MSASLHGITPRSQAKPPSKAGALLASCIAIRTFDVVEQIEGAIGKPVITANQAMIWQYLGMSGCDDIINGYGKLLRNTNS